MPKISVTERNQQYTEELQRLLETDNIFRPVVGSVKIKDGAQWHLHWVNTAVSPIHLQDFKNLGYLFVDPEELDCDVKDFGGQVSPEKKITIGPRGEEVLMKVPQWYWEARQKKKASRNYEALKETRLKSAVVDRVGSQMGDQAATYINKSVRSFDVTDARGAADE